MYLVCGRVQRHTSGGVELESMTRLQLADVLALTSVQLRETVLTAMRVRVYLTQRGWVARVLLEDGSSLIVPSPSIPENGPDRPAL